MKAKLPWLIALALLAAAGGLFWSNRQQAAELAQLHEESRQYQEARANAEAAQTAQAQTDKEELTRLRKDTEDLLRLRNEARQLRVENQNLLRQVQTAQDQAQSAASQAQLAQSQVQVLRRAAEQATQVVPPGQQPGQPGLVPRPGVQPAALSDQDKLNVCINNLRQIDGAKQQWALENKKNADTLVSAADILPYLRGNVLPACPAGGVYTLNTVGGRPLCSIPGHALPK